MSIDCSVIIPTRNRPGILSSTLSKLQSLPDSRFEIIVVDNASTDNLGPVRGRFPQVRWIELSENLGAAARNVAAAAAEGRVLLMLDDDSWPGPGAIGRLVHLFDERLDLGAVGCRVRLAQPPHRHDAGGAAGVFFNCGGAVRRTAMLEAGGYPIDYEYYVEEYDLCCRLWQRGWRVEPRGDVLIWHQRAGANRDNDRMLRLLVRNNLRVWQRFAPPARRRSIIDATIERYARVAQKEGAVSGFHRGLEEGQAEIAAGRIRRRALSESHFESLLGIDRARERLRRWADNHRVRRAALWTRGKGAELVHTLLGEIEIDPVAVYDVGTPNGAWRGVPLRATNHFDPRSVDGVVIGSLSLGTAEDLLADFAADFPGMRAIAPVEWDAFLQASQASAA